MADKDDGGPAFPAHSDIIGHTEGMTLRDYFAAQAISGWLASWPEGTAVKTKGAAEFAYQMADAMLAARKMERADG